MNNSCTTNLLPYTEDGSLAPKIIGLVLFTLMTLIGLWPVYSTKKIILNK